jgi:hypothetical protein
MMNNIIIEHNLEFLENIDKYLEKRGTISLIDYEKYKSVMNSVNSATDLEESIMSEKLKVVNERIIQRMAGRQPHRFIHDYFIGGKEIKELEFGTTDEGFTNEGVSNKATYDNAKHIYESLSVGSVNKLDTVVDSLKLISKSFLKTRLNLSDNDILDLKGGGDDITEVVIPKTEEVKEIRPEPKLNINIIKKDKKKPTAGQSATGTGKIDKDIEDDLNNEIFSYLKNMRNYGQSFHQILTKDNVKLNKIEQQQLKDQNKTTKELKNLNEFNYTLRIGFWKTLMMIATVLTTFIFTLLIMRIFPKFVR